MKKILSCLLVMMLLMGPNSYAFLYEVEILNNEQIEALTDEQILETYTDTVIERKALETFHGRAGFSPNEYKKYKEVLGLIVRLRQEMVNRKLDVPPLEDWLR